MRCALQWKLFVNTVGNSLLSGGLSSKLHPQCCECRSNTVTCYKADPARYKLNVSGLCWADLQGTGWPGLRMRAPAWMFLPFLEEAHIACFLAQQRQEAGGDQRKTATPSLLSASSQGHRELLNELLSSMSQFKRSCLVKNLLILPSPWGVLANSHSLEWASVCNITPHPYRNGRPLK